MCKVNGQSIFKWMFATPLAVWDENKRQRNKLKQRGYAAGVADSQEEINALKEKQAKDAQSQQLQDTAKNAQTNKPENKDITSLRVPLNTQGTGSNSGTRQLGLNLLGG